MNKIEKIDDCLSTRNGNLFIEECNTVDLAKQFGSPCLLFLKNNSGRMSENLKLLFRHNGPMLK